MFKILFTDIALHSYNTVGLMVDSLKKLIEIAGYRGLLVVFSPQITLTQMTSPETIYQIFTKLFSNME